MSKAVFLSSVSLAKCYPIPQHTEQGAQNPRVTKVKAASLSISSGQS